MNKKNYSENDFLDLKYTQIIKNSRLKSNASYLQFALKELKSNDLDNIKTNKYIDNMITIIDDILTDIIPFNDFLDDITFKNLDNVINQNNVIKK
jgi:type I restriction-modification system DNA methylase subunit